jgi:uncharacterized damage-inducible protein DinB
MTPLFSRDAFRELFAHMEWADAAVWRAALTQTTALADSRLRDLLVHIHLVQRAFLHVWTDRAVQFPNASDFADLVAVHQFGFPVYAELRRFIEATTDESLDRPITMPWVSQYEQHLGRTFSTPCLAETMFQVVSHTTHHRAQVNTRLRELGGEPPIVDYIAWVWFGKPAADWPVVEGLRPSS